MKAVTAAILAALLGVLAPTTASACRVPPRPEALQNMEADAIVLVQIASVEGPEDRWRAAATRRADIMGATTNQIIEFASPEIISSCGQWSRPRVGRYYVLYLGVSHDGLQVREAVPFWWAKRSGDARLDSLDRLMPFGTARQPSPDENHLLDLAEPRLRIPAGWGFLSDNKRFYSRTSPSSVSATLMRSDNPQRLIVDERESLPTEDSCHCDLIEVHIDLKDLYTAGKLPQFDP